MAKYGIYFKGLGRDSNADDDAAERLKYNYYIHSDR